MTVTPIVALDVSTGRDALALIERLGDACSFYKVGSELFTAEGPRIVETIRGSGRDVFLDLKFHDIPNTVRGAVRSAAALGVRLLTVHISGGRAMLEAAVAGAASGRADGGPVCKVLGVSVLTSLDAAALGEAWGREGVNVEREVQRLARLARSVALDGLVCSAREAAAVRDAEGLALELLIPGIRLPDSPADDQARAASPGEAAAAGARYIVLGRAVTRVPDPRAAMAAVLRDLHAVRA